MAEETPADAAAPAPTDDAPAAPARPAPPSEPAPAPAVDDGIEQAESVEVDTFQVAAKCLGLFVILATIYFWNLYCLQVVVPKVADKFESDGIELSQHQVYFIKTARKLQEKTWLGMVPIVLLMMLGLASIISRMWNLFSGIYFTLIVVLFLLFLYGWLVFAVPLIQLQRATGGGGSGPPVVAPK